MTFPLFSKTVALYFHRKSLSRDWIHFLGTIWKGPGWGTVVVIPSSSTASSACLAGLGLYWVPSQLLITYSPLAHHITWDTVCFIVGCWVSFSSVSSVAQLCPTLCNPMDCSTPGFAVHHQLLELAQTHVYQVGDAIQPSHPLSSPSPPAFSLTHHQGLF